MKVALNTNITKANQKSNSSVLNQNNPNFTSRTPVFIFPEEKRLMPNWNRHIRSVFNRILDALNMQTKEAQKNKHFSPKLFDKITRFVHDNQLGQVGTQMRGKETRFHDVRAYTDDAEKAIAKKLDELGVKFAQVELD